MTEHNFEQMRRAMVASQLRTNAVDDPRVIDAMGRVARERHVPADRLAATYIDRAIPLGNGRALNPPLTTGRLLSEARPQPTDKALLIGAATGYAAALLGELAGSVVAVEEDPALLEAATSTARAGNIRFVAAPLAQGSPEDAPFDLILIDGAIEQLPEALVGQLAEGGRLVTAVLERGVTRLASGRRSAHGFGLTPFLDAEAVPLPGFAKPRGFVF